MYEVNFGKKSKICLLKVDHRLHGNNVPIIFGNNLAKQYKCLVNKSVLKGGKGAEKG